jgi:hypothetical protein
MTEEKRNIIVREFYECGENIQMQPGMKDRQRTCLRRRNKLSFKNVYY